MPRKGNHACINSSEGNVNLGENKEKATTTTLKELKVATGFIQNHVISLGTKMVFWFYHLFFFIEPDFVLNEYIVIDFLYNPHCHLMRARWRCGLLNRAPDSHVGYLCSKPGDV